MGDAKQLRRNFLWNTFGQIVYMVCHFLFGILILSLAGAEQDVYKRQKQGCGKPNRIYPKSYEAVPNTDFKKSGYGTRSD